jgi:hypothetical protein
MKRILILVSLLLFTALVVAQDINFVWDLSPDDSLLGANGGYRLYLSKQSGSYAGAPVLTVRPGTTSGSIVRPGLGRFYFVAVIIMKTAIPDEIRCPNVGIRNNNNSFDSGSRIQVKIGTLGNNSWPRCVYFL